MGPAQHQDKHPGQLYTIGPGLIGRPTCLTGQENQDYRWIRNQSRGRLEMHGLRSLPMLSAAGVVIAGLAQPAAAQEAEVIHWWTSGGESAAVKVFADKFTEAGGTWTDHAVAGGSNARTAGINRFVGGDPPTAKQFNTGLQFDEIVNSGFLRDMDDVAEAG
jgi:ABC-type glycerol-3-phosphate transport system substrate-binding protein